MPVVGNRHAASVDVHAFVLGATAAQDELARAALRAQLARTRTLAGVTDAPQNSLFAAAAKTKVLPTT